MPERSEESVLRRKVPISVEIKYAREFEGTRSLREDASAICQYCARRIRNSYSSIIENAKKHI